ncbi:uncharacterized protein LOC113648470 [Tachysurus ichikawai]
MSRRGDRESTMESTDTSQAPVQTAAPVDSSLMDSSSLFLEAGVCSDDSEDSLDEFEGRYEKVIELDSELDMNTSYMVVREKEPGEHFSQNQKGYRYLRREREQDKLCLAQAMESRARLENENIDLLCEMSTLRCSMHQLRDELAETQRIFAEKNKQEQDFWDETSDHGPNLTHNEQILVENEQLMQIHNILKMRYKRMLESITQCNAFLMSQLRTRRENSDSISKCYIAVIIRLGGKDLGTSTQENIQVLRGAPGSYEE